MDRKASKTFSVLICPQKENCYWIISWLMYISMLVDWLVTSKFQQNWVENSWILANIDYVSNLGIYTCYHIGDCHIADGRQYEDQQLGGYSYRNITVDFYISLFNAENKPVTHQDWLNMSWPSFIRGSAWGRKQGNRDRKFDWRRTGNRSMVKVSTNMKYLFPAV